MKINGPNTEHVESSDDAKSSEKASIGGDKEAFKKLLKRKKGANSDRGSKENAKHASDKSQRGIKRGRANQETAHRRSGQRVSSRRTAKQEGGQSRLAQDSRETLGKTSKFGERLKEGKLQLGQQYERHERLGTERNVERHQNDTRLEDRHRKSHGRKVHTEHERRGQERTEVAAKMHQKSPKQRPQGKAKLATEGVDRPVMSTQSAQVGDGHTLGASKADGASQGERADRRALAGELAQKLVGKAHLGEDGSGRRIMLLDLEVPGRGNIRIRLRRRGDGFEVRMRPENQELARDLRHEREHFRQVAAENDVDFTSIEIV